MLSLRNLSVPNHKKTVTNNLQAVFEEGYTYGILAPNPEILRPLLDCISGRSRAYGGEISYGADTAAAVAYIDCSRLSAPVMVPRQVALAGETAAVLPQAAYRQSPAATTIDLSKKIFLLHHLPAHPGNNACGYLLSCLLPQVVTTCKTIIITSNDYDTLRDICDFIYLYDKKTFPIIVEKSDFAELNDFFENVFKQ